MFNVWLARVPRLFAVLIAVMLLATGPTFAQDTANTEAPAAEGDSADPEADAAATQAAAADEAANEALQDAAQVEGAADTPAEAATDDEAIEALTNTEISPEELALRVLPLTADELASLADTWLAIVKGQTAAVVTEQLAILEAEADDGDPVSRDRLNALAEVRGRGFANFMSVVNSLELKGGDEAAVAQYRAYRNAILVEETQAADWRTLLAKSTDWATDEDGGIALALNVLIIFGAFVGLLLAARFIRGVARRSFSRVPNLSKLLQAFIVMVIYWLTLAIGLMVVLGALGVNIAPLFALLGGASFILAFAMQDTLGNLAAGIMIMLNHPFDEGDYVTVAGTGGTVQSVSVVSTTVVTPDNQVIVIPNSKVWGDIITNVTASETRRVDLVFGIGYNDSIEDAQRVLEETVAAHPLVLRDPEPVIRVNELADSSVNFVVRPWVDSSDYWTVYWDLTRQVKERFDKAGISIPFPQSDMHLHVSGGGAAPDALVPSTGASSSGPTHGVGRPAGAPDYRSGDTVEVDNETENG